MRKKIGVTFFLGILLASVAWFNLAPIIPPPGATGSTGPQGSPGISGSPGPQGSPGPNTIAATTEILKGDNAGGAVAATQGTDYARSGYATTVTNGTTTTLTAASQRNRFFTGSQDQVVKLPVTSTLYLGFDFLIVNNSTDTIQVVSSGDDGVINLSPGEASLVTCILLSGTTAASWDAKEIAGSYPTASDAAYGAGWNGSTSVPNQDRVYDKIEAVVASIPTVGTAKLSSLASDNAVLDWGKGVLAGATVAFTSSNGLLEVTFATPLSDDQYIPIVLGGAGLNTFRLTNVGSGFFQARSFNTTTGDPIDPQDAWIFVIRQ